MKANQIGCGGKGLKRSQKQIAQFGMLLRPPELELQNIHLFFQLRYFVLNLYEVRIRVIAKEDKRSDPRGNSQPEIKINRKYTSICHIEVLGTDVTEAIHRTNMLLRRNSAPPYQQCAPG